MTCWCGGSGKQKDNRNATASSCLGPLAGPCADCRPEARAKFVVRWDISGLVVPFAVVGVPIVVSTLRFLGLV
jgi:hypothetical protein